MRPVIVTERKYVCPRCESGGNRYDHLQLGQEFGPWPCSNDECRARWKGIVVDDESVELTACEDSKPAWALLYFRGLYLLVPEFSRIESPDYFYHSHQCPTNLLHRVEEVYDPATGHDPHGTIRFVANAEDSDEVREAIESGDLEKVFAALKTDGQPAPSEWPEADEGAVPFLAEMRREHSRKAVVVLREMTKAAHALISSCGDVTDPDWQSLVAACAKALPFADHGGQ